MSSALGLRAQSGLVITEARAGGFVGTGGTAEITGGAVVSIRFSTGGIGRGGGGVMSGGGAIGRQSSQRVLDGITLTWLATKVRPDTKVLANDVLCQAPEAAENLKNFKQRFPKVKILPISAETGEGIEAVRKELFKRVHGKA